MKSICISGRDYPVEFSDSKGFKVNQWQREISEVGGVVDINLRLNFGAYFASIDLQARVDDVDLDHRTMKASYDNVTQLSRDIIDEYFKR